MYGFYAMYGFHKMGVYIDCFLKHFVEKSLFSDITVFFWHIIKSDAKCIARIETMSMEYDSTKYLV